MQFLVDHGSFTGIRIGIASIKAIAEVHSIPIAEVTSLETLSRNDGSDKNKIVLDPGIGFGKTYEQNLEVLKRLGELKTLGYPILLGTSRKSVIGNTLDLPAQERVEGTIATTVLGIRDGVDIVRVHDVEKNLRAAKMADAIYRR